jgi:hypothetical protein
VIEGPEGKVVTNALIDNGSDVTLITKRLVKTLKLEGERSLLNIKTLHGTESSVSERVNVGLGSTDGEFFVSATNVSQLISCRVNR